MLQSPVNHLASFHLRSNVIYDVTIISTNVTPSLNPTCNESFQPINVSAKLDEESDDMHAFNEFYYYFWTYAVPTIFALILLVGATGNLLVIYVILSRREMRSITNLMLVNLAVADLTFLFTTVPYNAMKYAGDAWMFGDAACRIAQYCLYVPAYVTIYTLVAISALRFATVVGSRSTAQYRTRRNALLTVLAVWACALAGNVPTMLSCRVNTFPGTNFTYCGMDKEAVWPVYLSFFAVGYALPLCVITVLYAMIVSHLARHAPASVDQSRSRERNARTLRVVVLVVVVFGVSWLPTHLQSIAGYFGLIPKGVVYEVFRILWSCMMFGNSCANPIIYHSSSADFRKNFRASCLRCFCCAGVAARRGSEGDGGAGESRGVTGAAGKKRDAAEGDGADGNGEGAEKAEGAGEREEEARRRGSKRREKQTCGAAKKSRRWLKLPRKSVETSIEVLH